MLTLKFNIQLTDYSIKPKGELWTLGTQQESGKTPNNSFIAYTLMSRPVDGSGGQNNWVRLFVPETTYIKALNENDPAKWAWADGKASEITTIYLGSGEDALDTEVTWPRICIGSKDDANRNQVSVLRFSDDGKFAKIEGIPRGVNYGLYNHNTTPWLVHHTWCSTPDGKVWETPQGIFWMPLWDPSSGFETSDPNNDLWLNIKYLYKRIG